MATVPTVPDEIYALMKEHQEGAARQAAIREQILDWRNSVDLKLAGIDIEEPPEGDSLSEQLVALVRRSAIPLTARLVWHLAQHYGIAEGESVLELGGRLDWLARRGLLVSSQDGYSEPLPTELSEEGD